MTGLLWVAAASMVFAAFMLVAGAGAPALWIAVITVGVAVVVISRTRGPRVCLDNRPSRSTRPEVGLQEVPMLTDIQNRR